MRGFVLTYDNNNNKKKRNKGNNNCWISSGLMEWNNVNLFRSKTKRIMVRIFFFLHIHAYE